MSKSINYGQLMHKALRQLMAEVLSQVARNGLPGKHHFFITFDTTHPGVDMSAALRARYPKEMTIVLQEWFDDLAVMKDRFTVTLNFGNVPEPMVVPVRGDQDLRRPVGRVRPALRRPRGGRRRRGRAAAAADPRREVGEGEVVSLDKFRKH